MGTLFFIFGSPFTLPNLWYDCPVKRNTHGVDIHIVEALKKLPTPLINSSGAKVYFDKDKRNESIFEHIANKRHHLYVSDIARVPLILKNKNSLMKDRKKSGKFKNYIGQRGKTNEKLKHLIIITQVNKDKTETIVSIYPFKATH